MATKTEKKKNTAKTKSVKITSAKKNDFSTIITRRKTTIKDIAESVIKSAKKKSSSKTSRKITNDVPAYINELYAPMYLNAEISNNLDDNRLWTLATFGYNNKLANAVCEEINYQSSVLQIGATFGKQIDKIIEKIGPYGSLDILDVTPTQIDRCQNKFIYQHPKINFIQQNAANPIEKKYDAVVCYMLLHEVPLATKHDIINNILNALNPNGKVIFIDYHNPVNYHPFRYLAKIFNRLYQPFAEVLWKKEIHSFVENPDDFTWEKSLYFGQFYQKVVVKTKK